MSLELRRWAESCEKERRHLLKPTWTADARQNDDLADLRKYNAKLGDCTAMHRWNVQRESPTVGGTQRAGQLSTKASVLSELVQGVPVAQSKFMTPDVRPERRQISLHQKPTVHHRAISSIDPRTLDGRALEKLQAAEPFAPLPEPPRVPPRGPNTLLGQAGMRAAEWNDGSRALSQWELGARGDRAFGVQAEAHQRTLETAQATLGTLLKLTEKRGRRRVKPLEDIEGSRPRHPLQNPTSTLRRGLPKARPPEECDYAPPYAPPAPAAEETRPGGPPSWFAFNVS